MDRAHEDLRCTVGRRPERADGLAGVRFLPAGDERLVGRDAGDVRCEVRHVRARHLERRGVVRAVTAEHLRLLALLEQLLRERLRVGGLLRREEDDVGVARHLRHVRRVVGRGVRSRQPDYGNAGRLQRRLDRRRETKRIRLLEVYDDDLLHVQGLDHVARVARALDVVARDVAEEPRCALLHACDLLRQVGARGGRGEVCQPRREIRLRRRGDRAGRRRAQNGDDALVADVLLRQILRRSRALLDRGVAADELDLQAVALRERLDRIARPAHLLLAEECGAAGQRRHERKRERALAAHASRGRSRSPVIRLCARGDDRRRCERQEKADALLHVPS